MITLINLLKNLWSNYRIYAILILIVTSIIGGGGLYIKYLRTYVDSLLTTVTVLGEQIELSTKENEKLRDDIVYLTKLHDEQLVRYNELADDLASKWRELNDLKKNPEIAEYLKHRSPDAIYERMRVW